MLKNGDMSVCHDCQEPATAVLDGGDEAFCALCGSYALTDISDGMKFIPEIEGED